jgi:hypothetical protein
VSYAALASGGADDPLVLATEALILSRIAAMKVGSLRWTPMAGQFGGLAKLGSGCCQAANFSVAVAQYASSGVRPASVECGRRAL